MKTTLTQKHRWLFRIALATLLIGAITALIAIAAPLGYRLGLWGFRTGFDILRMLVPVSAYIALLCLLITAILAVLGRSWDSTDTPRQVSIATVGAIIAALTWYLPQTYLEPDGDPYPSIHDISTDLQNPPRFSALLPLREDAENGIDYGVSRDMNPDLLRQLTQEAYPDLLEPVVLDVSPVTAFDRALTAANSLGWDIVDSNPDSGRIEAMESSFWFGFTDDIVVRLTPTPNGVRVDARSVSRMGKGDVGINTKRLRRFFKELQE